jgi:hypothetical protein
MMKIRSILTTAAVVLSCTAAYAADDDRETARQGRAADLDARVQQINRLDNNAKAKQAGMAAVSKETAVPLPTIEAEAKDHPNVGLAGLFVAHELSVKTKKPVDQLIKQRQGGKTWSELARENSQNLRDINQKLARIEDAMRNPDTAGAGRATREDRTAVRERERNRDRDRDNDQTGLNRRIQDLNSLDDKPGVMRTGLAAVSKETATPLPQIEELQKQQTSAGVGDLFVAQELATKTQKSADEFLKQHASGKSWNQIITDNNGDRSAIEQKLSRIEQAMKDAPQ